MTVPFRPETGLSRINFITFSYPRSIVGQRWKMLKFNMYVDEQKSFVHGNNLCTMLLGFLYQLNYRNLAHVSCSNTLVCYKYRMISVYLCTNTTSIYTTFAWCYNFSWKVSFLRFLNITKYFWYAHQHTQNHQHHHHTTRKRTLMVSRPISIEKRRKFCYDICF